MTAIFARLRAASAAALLTAVLALGPPEPDRAGTSAGIVGYSVRKVCNPVRWLGYGIPK